MIAAARAGLGRFVKRASVAADAVARPPSGVTVLIYHRIGGGSDSAVDLPVDVFDAHLQHLTEHHRVLTLDAAVAALAGPPDDAVDGVVVTFDDGTADFVEHAVPVLVRHQVPATLYVATEFVEHARDFPWGAPPATWAGLADAASTGLVTIGSHTHSHWLLDRLDDVALARDLDTSIDLIGERLGDRPRHFAYPKAMPGSPAAEIAVRRRFASASLAASRVNRPGRADLHRIWRTPIQRGDDDRFFAAKAAGGMRLEGELRALAARVRYRGAER